MASKDSVPEKSDEDIQIVSNICANAGNTMSSGSGSVGHENEPKKKKFKKLLKTVPVHKTEKSSESESTDSSVEITGYKLKEFVPPETQEMSTIAQLEHYLWKNQMEEHESDFADKSHSKYVSNSKISQQFREFFYRVFALGEKIYVIIVFPLKSRRNPIFCGLQVRKF